MKSSDLLPQFRQGEKSKFIILPVPYEKTTSYKKGAAKGPEAIISALNQVEFYDEELMTETWRFGVHTIPLKKIKSALPFSAPPEKFLPKLSGYIENFVRNSRVIVGLGGEHSISYGLVKPYCDKYKDLSVLHFDAHSDLRDEYNGTPYSHASVMRRISELSPVTQVGIRSISEGDYKIINKGNIRTFFAHQMRGKDIKKIAKQIDKTLSGNVYITIDLDVFDPAYMPGVGTPEPGGLSWYEILDILKTICHTHTIVGFDVVELCPLKGNNISEFTAAKLVYRMIGYLTT
ncbi:MAG: agmatinase [Planctomycetes bacterium]|nr:agmatinase [Planctomycetota bacterium]